MARVDERFGNADVEAAGINLSLASSEAERIQVRYQWSAAGNGYYTTAVQKVMIPGDVLGRSIKTIPLGFQYIAVDMVGNQAVADFSYVGQREKVAVVLSKYPFDGPLTGKERLELLSYLGRAVAERIKKDHDPEAFDFRYRYAGKFESFPL